MGWGDISPELKAEGCLQTGERCCLPKRQSASLLQHSFRTISVPPDQSRRRGLERGAKFTGKKPNKFELLSLIKDLLSGFQDISKKYSVFIIL